MSNYTKEEDQTKPTLEGGIEWQLDWQMRAVLEASIIAMNSDDPKNIKVTQDLIDYHKDKAKQDILTLFESYKQDIEREAVRNVVQIWGISHSDDDFITLVEKDYPGTFRRLSDEPKDQDEIIDQISALASKESK